MEMVAQAGDVVGVRVAQRERVHIEAAVVVTIKPVFQIFCDVRRLVVVVIGSAANIHVDENGLPVVELQEKSCPRWTRGRR